MLIKQKPITSQKLSSQDFRQFAKSVLSKGKSAVLPLFKDLEMLSSACAKVQLFANKFSKNFNLAE